MEKNIFNKWQLLNWGKRLSTRYSPEGYFERFGYTKVYGDNLPVKNMYFDKYKGRYCTLTIMHGIPYEFNVMNVDSDNEHILNVSELIKRVEYNLFQFQRRIEGSEHEVTLSNLLSYDNMGYIEAVQIMLSGKANMLYLHEVKDHMHDGKKLCSLLSWEDSLVITKFETS